MPSPILTDGATFKCPHGGIGTVNSGITVSTLAASMTINGQKPILAGAMITGFTPALGCTFKISGSPAPCVGFSLPPPSEQTLTINGQPVYAAADAGTIASVPSIGNGIPGLSISEPQTLVTA